MASALDRDDLIDGLRDLVGRARAAGVVGATIRIVGGAALRLAYFDRPTTVDIDARIEPYEKIEPLTRQIAEERNWPEDWLNDKAGQFIPDWGRSVDWQLLYGDASISIWVAPVDALLAMKLHALQGRPGRDTDDVAKLLRLNEITDVGAAEEHYEAFYPGDAFTPRTITLLEKMFSIGLPERPATPEIPKITD